MVSIEQTKRKYRGRKAATYDEVRRRQARWTLENETIERWLIDLQPSSVLDCPVGTGRFMPSYKKIRSIDIVLGVDASDEMLKLARKKASWSYLKKGDASSLDGIDDRVWDVVVCVRFLDLIEEEAMRVVVREVCRVAGRAVLLTIRLGDEYVPKVNTATHDRRGFAALIGCLGWRVAERVPFRDAGWEIIRLERRKQ